MYDIGLKGSSELRLAKEARKARKGRGLRKTFEEVYPSKKNVPVIESAYPSPESITGEVIDSICKEFRVSKEDVIVCFEDLKRDCSAKGKGYSDYKAGLEIFVSNAIKWGKIEIKKSRLEIMFEEGISVPINGKQVDNMEDYKKEYAIWEANNENN